MPTIWLSQTAVAEIVTEADDKKPNETGGVLLGYWATRWDEAVIVRAIGPGPNAIHSPFGFTPDGDYHWKEIEAEFRATDGRHTYLGDWHSHPSGGAFLSGRDRRTLKKIAKEPESQAPRPLMLVLSGGESWMAYIWKWEPHNWNGIYLGWAGTPMEVRLYG